MFKTHEEQGCTICVFLNLIHTKKYAQVTSSRLYGGYNRED